MIRLIILGSGSIVPTRKRFATSIYIDSGSHKILLDCGPGTIDKMRTTNINPWSIDSLLITHFHIDHITDLLPLIKLRAYNEKGEIVAEPPLLRIYGPKGLKEFLKHTIDQNIFLRYLKDKIGYHKYVEIHEMDQDDVKENGRIKICSKRARHELGLNYRLEIDDKIIVFSGDTAFDTSIVNFAKDADLLIHECSYPKTLLVGEHTSEEDLAQIIMLARPKRLVITHLYPAWTGLEGELVRKLSEIYKCRIYVAHDLLDISL